MSTTCENTHVTVSIRNPSIPLSSQNRIASSYIALRHSGFSQFCIARWTFKVSWA